MSHLSAFCSLSSQQHWSVICTRQSHGSHNSYFLLIEKKQKQTILEILVIKKERNKQENCRVTNYPVISLYKSQHEPVSFKCWGGDCQTLDELVQTKETFWTMRFFVICTETSPKRSMFLVSVIPILVRVSEYAYIFCSVKIKMNSRIIGIHLASPPLTVTCTLTACYSFTAMSTGTSSNVTGLLFCS